MGIGSKIAGADYAFSAKRLLFPVAGASYIGVFGGSSQDSLTRNLAVGSSYAAAVVGSPVVGTDDVLFTPGAAYIQTDVPQTADMTIITIGRPETDTAACALVSNAGAGGVGGTSVYYSSGTAGDSIATPVYGVATSGSANQSLSSTIAYAQFPAALICTYDNTTRRRRIMCPKLAADTLGSANANAAVLGGAMRIGSSYNASFPAAPRLRFVAIWPRVLTDTEINTAYAWLQDFYLRKFSVAV